MGGHSLLPGCLSSTEPGISDAYPSSNRVWKASPSPSWSVLLFCLFSRVLLWEHSSQGLYKPLKLSNGDLASPDLVTIPPLGLKMTHRACQRGTAKQVLKDILEARIGRHGHFCREGEAGGWI